MEGSKGSIVFILIEVRLAQKFDVLIFTWSIKSTQEYIFVTSGIWMWLYMTFGIWMWLFVTSGIWMWFYDIWYMDVAVCNIRCMDVVVCNIRYMNIIVCDICYMNMVVIYFSSYMNIWLYLNTTVSGIWCPRVLHLICILEEQ